MCLCSFSGLLRDDLVSQVPPSAACGPFSMQQPEGCCENIMYIMFLLGAHGRSHFSLCFLTPPCLSEFNSYYSLLAHSLPDTLDFLWVFKPPVSILPLSLCSLLWWECFHMAHFFTSFKSLHFIEVFLAILSWLQPWHCLALLPALYFYIAFITS